MNRRLARRFDKVVRGAPYSKAAQDSRTLPRPRDRSHLLPSARSWSAAALCRFFAPSLLLAISCSFGFAGSSIPSDALTDSRLAEIKFDQKLNTSISLDLHFRDESGKDVHLSDYFSKKPVILVLGYYGCPMLCTMVLNGMVEGLQDIRWSIGKEYDVINVSIDPHETPSLAAAKKRSYLKRYGRDSAQTGWHFLTGDGDSIQRLADEVGFRYVYDPLSKQYAHPSGLVVLTPDGKISRYLFGVTFSPRELYASLDTASSRKIGSRIQDLILLCFHYRPITGRYGNIIMITVRVLGIATLLGLPALVFKMSRRQRFGAPAFAPVLERPGEACVLPLPRGAGRGEGEQNVQTSTTSQTVQPDIATREPGDPS
jgi:protein SCO1/2